MPSEEPVLSVRKLNARLEIGGKAYSAAENVSFDLYKGKTLALVGESGCGKSVTALSILRILPSPPALPPEGEVLFKGQNLLNFSENELRRIRGGKIAMIFQDPATALNPVYTIGWQLLEAVDLHLNLSGNEAIEKVVQALSEVGISNPIERLDDYPHQMSGGMKQRVMIAMALLCEPDILIADEPTTALDVTIQAQVLELIKKLQQKKGMALLLITHDIGVVAEMADNVMVMYAGHIVESGTVRQIFDYPSHPYTQGLFNSRPEGGFKRGSLPTIRGTVPSLRNFPKGCRFHPRCPYVMEICKEGAVPNFIISPNPLHTAKCWLHRDKPKEVE